MHICQEHQRTQNKKQCEFARVQEAARKDIERAFGVLQSIDCHISWSSPVLGQKNLDEHHEMLCDSTQHDPRG